MLIITRSMDLDGLIEAIEGRKVGIWTCRTCARLCDGLGGDEAAGRLGAALGERGIEVSGVASTSASCLWSKVEAAMAKHPFDDAEVLIPLTCDVAASLLGAFTPLPRLECTRTWGRGGLCEDGEPALSTAGGSGEPSWTRLGDLDGAGPLRGPYA